jgi:thermopsin
MVIAIAAIMLMPSSAGVHGPTASGYLNSAPLDRTVSSPQGSPSVASPTPAVANARAIEARMTAALNQGHIPANEQLLPNLDPQVPMQNGMITPGYNTVPAPLGIADYGIQSVGGVNVATQSLSTSVEGSLNMNQISLLYLDSAGPDEYSIQLNTVATNVTVLGNSSFQFWNQNVVYYYQGSHTLHLLSAIVNFSSPALDFPSNTIVSGNGAIYPGFGYFFPYGPTLDVPEPFSIQFYNNLTVIHGNAAVYFNYTISSPAAPRMSGSYDLVVFNSQLPGGSGRHTPQPHYDIDGHALSGTGYIPLDAELILGGDGGGSTTSVFDLNATMQLFTEATGMSSYQPIPAAYDFGMETGETLEGVAAWASDTGIPTVHLGPGPAVQEPLWGVVGAPSFGHITATLNIHPSNTFVFGSLGKSLNSSTAAWAPVPANGMARYALPPGLYTFRFLLSDYTPTTQTLFTSSPYSISMASNPMLGVYTPLWAFGNAQLAAISVPGGLGTATAPYQLVNNPQPTINPLFGQFNDYIFPVFPGVLLVDTTAYVTVGNVSSFLVPLSLSWEAAYVGAYGAPTTQNLGFDFYATQHVSLVSNPDISGWFWAYTGGQSEANVVFWNSSHDLIAGNTFQASSEALFFYGGSQNTIWGDVFETSLPTAASTGNVMNYGDPLALELFESGDLIYNNAFVTPQTAQAPPFDIYSFNGNPAAWTDRWNVSVQPASDVRTVNGFALSGNVLGLDWEGGNYWSNYGSASAPYGMLPYSNGGQIDVGGDAHPLLPFVLEQVRFREAGLPAGSTWSVTLNGITMTSTGPTITFWDPTGSYSYLVGPVTGFTAHPAGGMETVSTHWIFTWVNFA